jgi:hypothetical protein
VQTLSYGFLKPQNDDFGDAWFPAEELNWQQVNDHNHDGVTSAPLAVRSVSAPPSGWVSTGGSDYRQVVTLPSGLAYDTCQFWVRQTDGTQIYPTITRKSATELYVYTTDILDDLIVYFR